MWKAGQYGLGMIPEINDEDQRGTEVRDVEVDLELAQLAQYGCGRSSAWQLPWLVVYLSNASASVVDVALSWQPIFAERPSDPGRIYSGLLNFALSHGVLFLASVVHHVPTAAPHSYLMRYMNVVLLLYSINSWVTVYHLIGSLE